jgi:hypothetical protein
MPNDVALFIRLCEVGELYRYLSDSWDKHADEFKKTFFANVFYPSTSKALHKNNGDNLAQRFKHDFPNVWQVLVYHKQDNYKKLPRQMQRLEADIMIGEVVKWFAENKPAVPIFTIHDSILTTKANVLSVRWKIREAFERRGLSPWIKSE